MEWEKGKIIAKAARYFPPFILVVSTIFHSAMLLVFSYKRNTRERVEKCGESKKRECRERVIVFRPLASCKCNPLHSDAICVA